MFAQPWKLRVWFRRRSKSKVDDRARDVAGMISDTFENGRHLGYRHDKAKVPCGRLTQRDNVNALSIDVDLKLIYLIVMLQDVARNCGISFRERIHRPLQGAFSFTAEQ